MATWVGHKAPAALALALLGLTPSAARSQREPIVLLCTEAKVEAGDPERFFVELDFDDKAVRFHRRDLPPMKMLMVQAWRVEFANDEKSPTVVGTVNRITGDISIEWMGASGEGGARETVRATCEITAPVF